MKKENGFTLIEIMIVVAIIGLLAATAIPNMVKARAKAQTTTCIRNLAQIDAAKSAWAIEQHQTGSATPSAQDIQAYLGRGKGVLPKCPADPKQTFETSYKVNSLEQNPECIATSQSEQHVLKD